jgi:type IV secretory pathway TrbL component
LWVTFAYINDGGHFMEADTHEKMATSKSKSASSKTTIKQKGKSNTASRSSQKEQAASSANTRKENRSGTAQSTLHLKNSAQTKQADKSEPPSKAKLMRKATDHSHQQTSRSINTDQRHHLIAIEAYLRAEQRGFCGGDPLADWLAAEAEIDARLSRKTKTQTPQSTN